MIFAPDSNPYLFEINQVCYLYIVDDYEQVKIIDRKRDNGNWYLTEEFANWQKEVYFRN